jgi:hypothetical protein
MRTTESFSEKVRTQVETMFTALKDQIQKETENILSDTEKTLDSLKEEFISGETSRKNEQAQFKTMIAETEKMIAHAEGVNTQIAAALNRK